MSNIIEAHVSSFFPKLMYGRPCQEQAVMAWITYRAWCEGKPSSIAFLCEASGTSNAKVSICVKSLLEDGLICEEHLSENRVGYFPCVSATSLSTKLQNGQVVEEEVGEEEKKKIEDSKEKEEEEKKRKKKEEEEPPSLATIQAVCLKKGWRFKPEDFVAYYANREWRMRDGGRITKKNWYYLGAIWDERSKSDMRSEIVKSNSSLDAVM